MRNGKRILTVRIRHMVDESPDTSYLGEYGNRPTSEYSIDRAHSEDCASVRTDVQSTKKMLEHIQQTIGDLQSKETYSEDESSEWQALENAYDEVCNLFESIDECDCGFSGHWNNREYRYFNPPVENYKGESAEDIRKYVLQDYKRMEDLNNGNFSFIGISAQAEVVLTGDVVQRIHSGGLWGRESDSEKSYLESVEQEELGQLKTELTALGFSKRAIAKAFQSIERRES